MLDDDFRIGFEIDYYFEFQVSSYIEEVYKPTDCFILIKLDLDRIRVLGLEVNAETIQYSICISKLRLKMHNVMVCGSSLILVRPDSAKHGHALNSELSRLVNALPNVVIAGLTNVSRAVIAVDETTKPESYKLCVEGIGLGPVMATYGVIGSKTKR